MSDVILASPSGEEQGAMLYTRYDFEVGDFENSFLVTFLRSEWKNIEEDSRIYIPDTEYGGLYKHLETSTNLGEIAAGGYTWRGMLQNRIIEPPAGQDYATEDGELNAVIGARVSAAFPGLFVGSSESTGVYARYQHKRYTTMYQGIKDFLMSVGYKPKIAYNQDLKKVVLSAVPIVDYSSRIEYSSDMNADYQMTLESTGVNHLICLGQGELRDRVVVHLYMDKAGNISQTQTQFGADEVALVYDYAGASREDLIQGGTQQLQQKAKTNQFHIELKSSKEVDIGDIVGGRDYITGKKMTAPITTKIVTWRDGFQNIEYKLSDDVHIEQSAGLLSINRESSE